MYYLRVDKTLKIPVYQQLKVSFEKAILSGLLRHGQQLPTEEEVCQAFDLSHYIIRHAYDQLLESGLIIRIKGKGSFVNTRPVHVSSLTDLAALENQLREMHRKVEFVVQYIETITDDPQAYLALSIKPNDKCLHLKRILLADGYPIYAQDWYLPEHFFPKIRKQLTDSVRWIDVVNLVHPVASIQNFYSVKKASDADALTLEIAKKDPIFVNRSHLMDESSFVVAYVRTYYPGKYTRLEVRS